MDEAGSAEGSAPALEVLPVVEASLGVAEERYAIEGTLGEGAGGVVYRARDRETGELVALKTLVATTPVEILQLKNEFRTLQGLHHPNLVRLGEFFEEKGRSFLSMELVTGGDFLTYVTGRPAGEDEEGRALGRPSQRVPATERERGRHVFDEARLRSAIGQLACAVVALHEAGIVHRDIKPSNVLVTNEGRVVVLDFGTALRTGSRYGRDDGVTGTAPYMAPEQVTGEGAGPPADWYALGAMLFRALTGRLPFEGTTMDVMSRKVVEEPPPAASVQSGIPEDLAHLADRLLKVEPQERAGYAEIAACLQLRAKSAPTVRSEERLIGRERELAWLKEAYDAARAGTATAAVICGESGVGKSLLLRAFLAPLEAESPPPVVLFSRCYERSSVPFKALDGAAEALAFVLSRMRRSTVERWLDDHAGIIAKLFPELGLVPALAERAESMSFALNEKPKEARRRGFAALRSLFAGLSKQQPVVIVIDDLQWSDEDSISLLRTLLEPPGAPPILLLCTLRVAGDGAEAGEIVQKIVSHARSCRLEKFDRAEAVRFVREVVAREALPEVGEEEMESILSEAAGHPMFLAELVRQERRDGPSRIGRLDDLLRERIAKLADPARQMLEAVCVATIPIAHRVAADAAGVHGADLLGAVPELTNARLAQTWGTGRTAAFEPYHNRVRAAVVAGLSPEALAAWHGKLALAFERAKVDAPDALSAHWLGAGDKKRALDWVCRAAEKATAAFAFDRAAQYYAQALELSVDPSRTQALRVAVADALSDAGRGAEAAKASLLAAETASADDAVELRRRAAEQFLISGHLREGRRASAAVLAHFGMRWVRSNAYSLILLLLMQLWLRVRGYGFQRCDPKSIKVIELQRVDVCWSTSTGLSLAEAVRAGEFSTRQLILAIGAGDPSRYYRAMIVESVFMCAQGGVARAAQMLETVRAPCESGQYPFLVIFHELGVGWQAFFKGEFRLARTHCQHSRDLFEQRALGRRWERDMVAYWELCAGIYMGELPQVAERLPRYLNDAQDRGDLLFETLLRVGDPAILRLAEDDMTEATRGIRELLPRWPKDRFLAHHMYALWLRTLIDLYNGGGPDSAKENDATWWTLVRGLHLEIKFSLVRALQLRGAAHLGAAEVSSSPREHLARAENDARRLRRSGVPWCDGWAPLLSAGVEYQRGHLERARRHLADAIALLDKVELGLHAASARVRLGDILGGDEGAALRAEGLRFLDRQGVKAPRKLVRAFAPGFDRK